MDAGLKNEMIHLWKNSKVAFVSSVDENSYPATTAFSGLRQRKVIITMG